MDVAGKPDPTALTWLAPLLCAILGLAMLPLDIPIAVSCAGDHSRFAADFWEIAEVFGHGIGATLIIIAAMILGALPWRCLPWLISGSLGAGMLANVLKLCVSRSRPRDYDLSQGTVWGTFIRGDSDWKAMQSLPSSHTATAVGLAVVLSAMFPRGRYLFAALALLVGLQRVATNAHFPSDVFAGAAVGWVVGICCASFLQTTSTASPTT